MSEETKIGKYPSPGPAKFEMIVTCQNKEEAIRLAAVISENGNLNAQSGGKMVSIDLETENDADGFIRAAIQEIMNASQITGTLSISQIPQPVTKPA